MATAATGSASAQPNDPTGIHRYKLAPPLFDGDYSKYEDWKHKFIAYMALQHPDYTRLLKSSEAATTVLTDADLQTSAQDDKEAKRWTSMSRDLHYIPKDRGLKKINIENRVSIFRFKIDILLHFLLSKESTKISIFWYQNIDIWGTSFEGQINILRTCLYGANPVEG